MSRRPSPGFAAVALVALIVAPIAAMPAPAFADQDPIAPREARVTYLIGASIYIDAGRDDGLAEGQVVEIVRGAEVVATLRVTFLSSHSAVCARESGEAPLSVGDAARFVPGVVPSPSVVTPTPPAAPAIEEAPAAPLGVRGRIGVRWLAVRSREPGGEKFSQPSLDLYLDGSQVGGAPIDFTVDVRSRRTYRTLESSGTTNEGLTSVYRLSAAWQEAGSPWRVSAGRQFSPSLASISIFDGVMAEYQGARWGAGLFTGTQPVDGSLGYSGEIHEHGGFLQWRNAPGAARRWSLTTGAIGSYQQGDVNREFAYGQASWSDRRLSIWLTEEADLNRGWKKEMEGSSVSLTSTLFNLRWRASGSWTLSAGYDNRRNVRLFRDRITPVTEFDDEYRTGAWAGASARFLGKLSAGFDLRSSTGGSAGGADGYSVFLGAGPMSRAGIDVRTRSTRYTNDRVEGWLHSLSLGASLGARWHAEITGGVRDETDLTPAAMDTRLTWYGLDADVAIGRHVFLGLSVEHDQGELENSDQGWLSLSYRF
jgi:hypothetical protein